MVGIFLLPCIKDADGIAQNPVQILLDPLRIALLEGIPKGLQALRVGKYRLFEPILNLKPEDLPHFFIRDTNPIGSLRCPALIGQITGGKEDTPEILNAVVDLVIGQIEAQFFFQALSGNQALDLCPCRPGRLVDEVLHQAIAAGIDPVGLRSRLRIRIDPIYVIDDVPGAINLGIAEAIAIVPFPGFLKAILLMVIGQKLLYFFLCEAKLLVEPGICDGKDLEVVQAREDALLGNTKAAGQNRKFQKIIGFQGFSKHSPNQRNHFPIIAILKRLIQRDIVFIDQNYCFFPIMLE